MGSTEAVSGCRPRGRLLWNLSGMNQGPAFGSRHLRLNQGKMTIYVCCVEEKDSFLILLPEEHHEQGPGDGNPKLCRLENFCFYL